MTTTRKMTPLVEQRHGGRRRAAAAVPLVAWVRQTTLSFTFLFFSVSTVLANIRSRQPLRPYLDHARTLVF